MEICEVAEKSKGDSYLNTSRLRITYQNKNVMTFLAIPRRYTIKMEESTGQISISIGPSYDKKKRKDKTNRVTGRWRKNGKGEYELRMKVYVGNDVQLDELFKNKINCDLLSTYLEAIAFAETNLMYRFPMLQESKIYSHFVSLKDKSFDKTEYRGRLKNFIHDERNALLMKKQHDILKSLLLR